MRLAIIRKNYTPYGGAERFIQNLVHQLQKKGVATTVICENWGSSDGHGPESITLKRSGWTRTSRQKNFQHKVIDVLKQKSFDIVQSHERVLGADVYRLGDGIHASWFHRILSESGRMRQFFLRRDPYHQLILKTERQIAQNPHALVVVNSDMVAKEARDLLDIPAHRIFLIPNGVDVQHFVPPSDAQKIDAKKQYGIPPDVPVLCFVGSDFSRKGAFLLIEAMKLLPGFHAIICGKDKRQHALLEQVSKQKIADRVHLTGPLTDVRPVYWASDLEVLPSLYDPLPNVTLEAIACGLPVVTTKHAGSAEALCANGVGWICDRDPGSIASAVREAFQALSAGTSQRARALALRYSNELVTDMWMNFYSMQLDARQGKANFETSSHQ